jgi:phosphinothricin tripeptide acetyl hydrolase
MASPELQTILDQLRSQESLLDAATVAEQRAAIEGFAAAFPLPADVRCERTKVGDIPAEWIRPNGSARDGAILYLHGGGYSIGSIDSHRTMIASIARATGVQALAIDYRLAPECPFPAAVEDATSAYRWILEQGIAPHRLAIAGDSAGGGLTVATLVALRDDKVRLPAAAVCVSPWVDLEGIGTSMTERAERDPIINKKGLLRFAAAYLGTTHCRTPLAAPLYADLSGLPPMLIQVGEAEALYDDAIRLAERAQKAGVDVTLASWPEMFHVWHFFAPMLAEGRKAIEEIGTFIRSRVG